MRGLGAFQVRIAISSRLSSKHSRIRLVSEERSWAGQHLSFFYNLNSKIHSIDSLKLDCSLIFFVHCCVRKVAGLTLEMASSSSQGCEPSSGPKPTQDWREREYSPSPSSFSEFFSVQTCMSINSYIFIYLRARNTKLITNSL
jgi:hypothetical protein